MSKRANPTLIGIFVAGALAVLVAAILVLGSGNAFRKTEKAIMYFDGSVYGLQVGAPVVFRGVRVGTVRQVGIEHDPKQKALVIPVIVEFTADQTINPFYKSEHDKLDVDYSSLISQGLRAKLELQSLLTGQLMVQLDFNPGKEGRVLGLHPEIFEIPTLPSPLQAISDELSRQPLDQVIGEFTQGMKSLSQILNSKELRHSIEGLARTADNLESLSQQLRSDAPGLLKRSETTLAALEKAANKAATSLDSVNTLISPESETVQELRRTLKDLSAAAHNVNALTGDDSATLEQLQRTLRELRAMARNVQNLADTLDRHPESLLKGKAATGETP